jgi:hypothetical protein
LSGQTCARAGAPPDAARTAAQANTPNLMFSSW